MTKKQIKALAELYAAGVVYNAMGAGAYSEMLTDEENDELQDHVTQLAERMAAKRGEVGQLSLSCGTLDDLVNLCKSSF